MIDLGDGIIPENQLSLVQHFSALIIEGRLDQAQMLLNSLISANRFRSVNHVHNQLYRDVDASTATRGKRSIWDKDITRYQNSTGWIRQFFDDCFSPEEKSAIADISITRASSVASIGSCFATNISKHLRDQGMQNVHTLRVEEAVNSPRLIDLYLNPEKISDHEKKIWDDRFSVDSQNILNGLKNMDLLVLTFGVGFDFIDREGNILIDPTNLSQRLRDNEISLQAPTPGQQTEYIKSCIRKISETNPDLPVFVTLSPVPLSGFHGDYHVAVANTLSKANLAIAIQSARQETPFFYLPTFEIVTALYGMVENVPTWGEDGTSRHPKNPVIKDICSAFVDYLGLQN
ncbi:GSCFA domain-containing protein [Nisaea sediminum]|uniref:GSCFA domain-containing protein n=1 Tax=Nisaea sediminum TaxID=2775867 RepID=UPI001865BF4F|nr:GSCFA domain-containing protein [Nisaea sediminum]